METAMEDVMKTDIPQRQGQGPGSQLDGSGSGVSAGVGGVAQQAKTFGRDVKDKTSELTGSIMRAAKTQAQGLGATASGLADQAKDKVESAVNDKKSAGADYIGSIASAVHRAAGEIGNEVPQAGQYIHQAADRLDDVAAAVREKNVRELVGEVEGFARQQPMLFFGGTLLLGFAAIRFLKTTQGGTQSAGASTQPVTSSPKMVPGNY
jgi:hypothetical protein